MKFSTPVEHSDVAELDRLLQGAQWRDPPGRGYATADVTDIAKLSLRWPLAGCTRAFFLKLAPGGTVHRHADVGDVESYHLPVITNARAVIHAIEDGREMRYCMQPGSVYRVERTLEHWSVNHGDTDRIHLIVER